MDALKSLQQIDELFYEIFAILVFFPKTLWLILRYPQRMMDYADTELGDVLNEQYNDSISPPKFMMICLGLGYLSERLLGRTPEAGELPGWMQDWEAMLAFRMLLFSLIPLIMALQLVRHLRQPLDRETLRPPFYSQCYLGGMVVLFNVIISTMSEIFDFPTYANLAIIAILLAWYIENQTIWIKNNLKIGYLKGLKIVSSSLLFSALGITALISLAFAI